MRRPLEEALARRHPPLDDPLAAIREGRVLVDGAIVTNPRSQVRRDASIIVREPHEPQGVRKLSSALDTFAVAVAGKVALDVGACTGGFTLALLRRGARRVFAVDVGFGQLLGSLRQDRRVVNLERTNLAAVTSSQLGEPVDVVVVDVTKLALRDVIAQLTANLDPAPGTELVGLVKPMFELGRGELPSTAAERADAVDLAVQGARDHGWGPVATMESPVRGHNGAIEHFIHARRSGT